jgi:GGDEF domain-containing protein
LSEEIELPSGEVVAVGASVGIAQFPKDGVDMAGLIEYADQSMYECKSSGHMPLEFA